jgi:WD40 repeat protein/tRNA A-37 threonylcarbamoyl transferase component Bud32
MTSEPETTERSSRAEEVFAEFLEHAEIDDKADFAALLAEHPDLRSELSAIHRHWRAMSAAFSALSSLGGDAPANGSSAALDALLAKLRARGDRAARYALSAEIAKGAMGRIVRAWDEDLRREVAMKIQREDRADPRMRRRFLEEAQIAGQLDHPGIVPIHELGVDAKGRPYFTMRLVRGRPLDEIVRLAREGREGWSRTRVLHVVLRVCETIAYAHDRGVIHRDLKPQNVMVGLFGETYVMDWGLARAEGSTGDAIDSIRSEIEHESGGSPLLTQFGDVVGTPAYMAPEQARGDACAATRAIDVYALGAILYQVCCGHAPYAEARVDRGLANMLERLRAGGPAPLGDDTPGELRAIVERAMARESSDRYPSVAELGEDLRAFLEVRVVRAYSAGRFQELRKWIARNRALSAITLTSIVLLAVAAITSTRAFFAADRARADLDLTAKRLATELDRSEFRNARLMLGTDHAVVAEDELWRQHLVGTMPRATHWALADAYERSPCLAMIEDSRLGNAATCALGQEQGIAVGDEAGVLRILDPTTLVERRRFAPGLGPILELVALPPADRMLLGCADGTVAIVTAHDGAIVWSARAHEADVRALAVAPTGTHFASGGREGQVLLWPIDGGTSRAVTRHAAPLWSLAFDGSGATLASGDETGWLRTTTIADGASHRQRLSDRNLMAIVYTRERDAMWIGSADQVLLRVELTPAETSAPRRVRRIPSRNGTVRDLVRDADGTIVAGGWWRIDRYASDGSLIGPVALRGSWKLDIDPSSGNVVVTGDRRFVSLFEPTRRAVHEFGGTNLALSGDGRRLLVHRGNVVTIHDLTATDPTLEIGRLRTGGWIATNGDSSLLAAMFGADRAVHVFDTASHLERMQTAGAKFVTSNETFALSADGAELATIADTATVRRVSTRDGATIAEFDFAPSTLIRVRYVEKGQALMVLGVSPPIGRRIDLATGRTTELPVGRSLSVIALSSDGRYFATAQQDGRIAVHDRTSGSVRDLGDRSGTVWSMTFDPSDPGLLVCSTRADGVAFWDVESGEMCYRWTVDDGPMAQLQISADGRWLAAYSTRGVVVRDLRFFDRHIAGNAERRIQLASRLGAAEPGRIAAVREWVRTSRANR